jgi:hypothetical protein
VNGTAAWATEATEKNCLGQMIKIGKNKAVKPKASFAIRAVRWFLPRKIPAKVSYFIDISVDRYYQETNSLSGAGIQYGGSGKLL